MEQASDSAVKARIQELVSSDPNLGYRALHKALQKDAQFSSVGLQKVQKFLREVKAGSGYAPSEQPEVAATPPPAVVKLEDGSEEMTISRAEVTSRFGMVVSTESHEKGGHAVNDVVSGAVVDSWNKQHPKDAIVPGTTFLISVNGKACFDDMIEELKTALECKLKIRRGEAPEITVDDSEAKKEAAKWAERKARVTAALIPGLKKLIAAEFGENAADNISRVCDMYQRVGRDEVHEEDGPLGKVYAPGYMAGLSPVVPFHPVKDYQWCKQLKGEWKKIRKELHSCHEDQWTSGAYHSSNEAYGKDWKILPVLTKDQWSTDERLVGTVRTLQGLRGVVPFEAFFARMPKRTKIAPHSDNLNYVLTSHLGLDLEEGQCSIKVGNEEQDWKEGDMLVFDTSYIHSTTNDSMRARYVLIFRFWHPGLSKEEQRALHLSHQILAGATGGGGGASATNTKFSRPQW